MVATPEKNLESKQVVVLKSRPIKFGVEAQKKHDEMVALVARAKKKGYL